MRDVMKKRRGASPGHGTQLLHTIYHQYSGLLYWRARRYYHLSHEDAEDVLQDVFRRVIEHMKRLEMPEKLQNYNYLDTVLRNCIMDLWRKQNPQPQPDETLDQLPATQDVEQTVLARSSIEQIQQYIQQLSPPLRNVLQLSSEGYSNPEIAAALNISTTTVATRLHRARQQLRQRLQKAKEEEEI